MQPLGLASASGILNTGDLLAVEQTLTGDPLLVTLDPLAGSSTLLTPLDQRLTDITHDPIAGAVYGTEPSLEGVVRIDLTTGELAPLGAPGVELLTVAVQPMTGTLFATGIDTLYTVDPTDGSLTPVSTALVPPLTALSFDPVTGELYGLERLLLGVFGSFVVNVYRIDPTDGSYEFLGDGGNFVGLAFDLDGRLFASDTGDTLAPPGIAPSTLAELNPFDGTVLTTLQLTADNIVALAFWQETATGAFSRGDTNGDSAVDVSDSIFLLAALFVPGSPAFQCEDSADTNDDGNLDVSDAVYLLASLFVPGSPPPPAPTLPQCGLDPTADGFECSTPTCP